MVSKNQVVVAPQTPGVYFFKNIAGKTIYIGKAQNLRMRLLSYFRNDELDARKRAMIEEASDVSWHELSSDIEALIREAALIKKLRPKYNVLMRDDKQYFYIAFTKERFPKIFVTHQPKNGQSPALSKNHPHTTRHRMSSSVGPFTDGWAIRTALKTLRRVYPYCRCALRGRTKHSRPCQESGIGRCLGVCCLKEKEWPNFYSDASERVKKYGENIKIIKKIFTGKYRAVINRAKKQMESASADKNYELAAKFRDELKALEIVFKHRPYLARDNYAWREKGLDYLRTILKIKSAKRIEIFDISNFQGKLAVGSMAVFTDGIADKKEYKKFKVRLPEKPNDTAMIKEIISRRLKHWDWLKPNLIIVDGGKAQLNAAFFAKFKVVALAKREEELYLPDGKIIKLKDGPEPLLHLLTSMRDEAHRFAITYHKKLRLKQISK